MTNTWHGVPSYGNTSRWGGIRAESNASSSYMRGCIAASLLLAVVTVSCHPFTSLFDTLTWPLTELERDVHYGL